MTMTAMMMVMMILVTVVVLTAMLTVGQKASFAKHGQFRLQPARKRKKKRLKKKEWDISSLSCTIVLENESDYDKI